MNGKTRKLSSLVTALFVFATAASIAEARKISPDFDPANFPALPVIDNNWFPLAPGTTFIYEAEEEDGLVRTETTVTWDTRVVAGVNCVVVHDVELILVEGIGWVLLEDTFDWFAQDLCGNVWYFGEETVAFEYDDDWNFIESTTEGSWEGGVDGAVPGIQMLASPVVGDSYYQEFYEDEAEDQALVMRLNGKVSNDYGDFAGCLVTKEWTALDQGHVEQKYFAPGIGLVHVDEHHGKIVRVELVDMFNTP
jgi:hypothetical protein